VVESLTFSEEQACVERPEPHRNTPVRNRREDPNRIFKPSRPLDELLSQGPGSQEAQDRSRMALPQTLTQFGHHLQAVERTDTADPSDRESAIESVATTKLRIRSTR